MITKFSLFESAEAYETVPDTFNAVHPMTEEELLAFVADNCKAFSASNTPLYRGVRFKGAPIVMAKPSEKERRSRPMDNAGNHYTLLVDNLESWAGWPKRSKSLCLATRDTRTRVYTHGGDGMVYRVIPLDGATIAVCATKDFWFSFQYLARFADGIDIPTISRRLRYDYAVRDGSWVQMARQMDEWAEKLARTAPTKQLGQTDKPASYGFVHDLFLGDWRKNYNRFLAPEKNGFWQTHYTKGFNIPGYNKEVWTESDCVMVESKLFDRLVREGKLK